MADRKRATAALVLARDPGAHWTAFDDAVVVYHSGTNKVYELNASAGLLWQCFDGSASLGELAADLSTGFGRPAAAVRRECLAVAGEMLAGQLVHDAALGAVTVLRPAVADGPEPRPDPLGPPERGRQRLGPYVALGHCFVVDAPAAVAAHLAPVLRSLLGDEEPAVRYRVWRRDRGYDVDEDGIELGHCPRLGGVTDLIQRSINQRAVGSMADAAVLHAGAVEWKGRAILIPGQSGAGKSTLVAALVRAGAGYLTDEAAALDPRTGHLLAYPKPISLRPGSWPLFPGLGRLDGRRGADSWLVDPERLRPGAIGSPCPVGAVVFAEGEHESPVQLRTETAPRALVSLLANWFPSDIGREAAFRMLSEVVTRVPSARLSGGPLDEAVEHVLSTFF